MKSFKLQSLRGALLALFYSSTVLSAFTAVGLVLLGQQLKSKEKWALPLSLPHLCIDYSLYLHKYCKWAFANKDESWTKILYNGFKK